MRPTPWWSFLIAFGAYVLFLAAMFYAWKSFANKLAKSLDKAKEPLTHDFSSADRS